MSRTEEKKKKKRGRFLCGSTAGSGARRRRNARLFPLIPAGRAAAIGNGRPDGADGRERRGCRRCPAPDSIAPQRNLERRQRKRGREAGRRRGAQRGENARRRQGRGTVREGEKHGARGESDATARPPGPPPRPPRSVSGSRCRCPAELREDPRRSAPRRAPIVRRGQSAPALPAAANRLRGPRGEVSAAPTPPPLPPPPRPVRADITALPGGAGPGGRARPPPRAARVVVERRRRVPHRASLPVRTGPPAWWTSSCRGRSRAPWGSPPRVSAGAGGPRGAAVPSGGRLADSAGKGPAGGCGLGAGRHGFAASPRCPSGRTAAALPAPAPSFLLASFFRSLLLFPRFGFLFLFLFPFSFLSFSFCSSVFVWGFFLSVCPMSLSVFV